MAEKNVIGLTIQDLKPSEAPTDYPPNGLYFVEESEYHGGYGISKSNLDKFNISGAAYKYAEEYGNEQTAPMLFGSAYHCAVLEMERFKEAYTDDKTKAFDRRTTKGKEAFATWQKTLAGKQILPLGSTKLIEDMQRALYENETAKLLLSEGVAEVACYWRHSERFKNCLGRCKIDYIRRGLVDKDKYILIDLKTTKDCGEKDFVRSVENFRYDVQQAYYIDGFKQATGKEVEAFIIIAEEKTEPFHINIFSFDEEYYKLGRLAYEENLAYAVECFSSGVFPKHSEDIKNLTPPRWRFKK